MTFTIEPGDYAIVSPMCGIVKRILGNQDYDPDACWVIIKYMPDEEPVLVLRKDIVAIMREDKVVAHQCQRCHRLIPGDPRPSTWVCPSCRNILKAHFKPHE